jgi:hypothetical protein
MVRPSRSRDATTTTTSRRGSRGQHNSNHDIAPHAGYHHEDYPMSRPPTQSSHHQGVPAPPPPPLYPPQGSRSPSSMHPSMLPPPGMGEEYPSSEEESSDSESENNEEDEEEEDDDEQVPHMSFQQRTQSLGPRYNNMPPRQHASHFSAATGQSGFNTTVPADAYTRRIPSSNGWHFPQEQAPAPLRYTRTPVVESQVGHDGSLQYHAVARSLSQGYGRGTGTARSSSSRQGSYGGVQLPRSASLSQRQRDAAATAPTIYYGAPTSTGSVPVSSVAYNQGIEVEFQEGSGDSGSSEEEEEGTELSYDHHEYYYREDHRTRDWRSGGGGGGGGDHHR